MKLEGKNNHLIMIFHALTLTPLSIIWTGLRYGVKWKLKNIGSWSVYFLWLALIIWGPRYNLSRFLQYMGFVFGVRRNDILTAIYTSQWIQFLGLWWFPLSIWLFTRGIRVWLLCKASQRAIDHLGLKTPTGLTPKVIKIIDLENKQRRVLVEAIGIDIASFRDRKGALESSFNAIVQDIRVTPKNRQWVEIHISDKELTNQVRFDEHAEELRKPYMFLVGESLDGLITADLCQIHHLLIAGATGGGKSVFFKQTIVGLLKSSSYLQLYLLDLKRGVEFRIFDKLNNVTVSKDEMSALSILQSVVAEMERRFRFLEQKGHNEIVPERDNLDRIVVAVDEASVLFTLGNSSRKIKQKRWRPGI